MTATLPDKVPSGLYGWRTGPQDWYYEGKQIWNNGKKCTPELPNISNLNANQAIGLLISSDTKLHIYLDGRHLTTVSGLPVDSQLWGAVDVYGPCTKIKSELLSGELDGVYVCLYFCCCLATQNFEDIIYVKNGCGLLLVAWKREFCMNRARIQLAGERIQGQSCRGAVYGNIC